MTTQLLSHKLIYRIAAFVAVWAMVLAGVFVPSATAQAAPATDDGTPGPFADGSRLEFGCRQANRVLEGQQDRLDLANHTAEQAQTWIDELKAKGKDTSALEAALSAFESAIASAQARHDEAQGIMDTHAGFDGDCKLTDREQARNTLRSVHDALREAHRLLSDAAREFRRAVRDWRQANRGTATP
jgi:hypothetical protein